MAIIRIIAICIAVFTASQVTAGPCLDKAIQLCKKHPGAVIKYGINKNGVYHAEAVWVRNGIEYPVDGEDSIRKIIPNNPAAGLKYYTWQEAGEKWNK